MALLKALGLGVLIITLRFLAPDVLSEGENTIIAFLHGATVAATAATTLAASVGDAHILLASPPALPTASDTTRF